MTDSSGGTPPFSIPGFPGFGQADMMGKMWELMRLNPFTAAMQGGQSANPSLSMMSDMLAPLTNIEELDKRVTDMRAVEHWLKLNLNMLQSAIQALEVQRATLATLRAFGAFAQSSVDSAQNAAAEKPKTSGWPMNNPAASAAAPEPAAASTSADDSAADSAEAKAPPPGFDPSGWWNVLQSQFNQLAHLAMIQPGMTGATDPAAAQAAASGSGPASGENESAAPGSVDDKNEGGAARKAPAKKAAPRKKPA
jgi:hypothetical protein